MDAVEKAISIIETCRSSIPEGTPDTVAASIRKADVARHLREGGLRIVRTADIRKLSAQQTVSGQILQYAPHPEYIVEYRKEVMGLGLGAELMRLLPVAEEPWDYGGRQYRVDVEVILP